ncbi:Toluene efflux pump ttgABC operon repressor [Hartmannibacter diazotrophicus]|uniref:Toluene efflux pump ttgABC operon repressor n=1 Tax=Hartmannibacter diazotrophicus TaxID=1482074 RepID=A0A2C9D4W8_9HYPH|nr:TetR/AcrR family transcriptional regulator [Hartmannibacter diazotrophicus]SON54811.1 Toluene efflux pump ttgABC operon repressor [Hartmannibacter diazotrophicus]
MSRLMRMRSDPEETRANILETAEEHFRRIGYQKTTVADIASALKMSPANVYRFFPSKAAIVGAICQRVTGEIRSLALQIAKSEGTVSERIERFVVDLHVHNKTVLMNDQRLHDMVSVAMEENWESIEAHTEAIRQILADLVREGVESGEFAPCDPEFTGGLIKMSFVGFLHPILIEQCGGEDLVPAARGVARMVLNGLKARS